MREDPNRGTGRTTRQMQNAPHRAIYVWCNTHAGYARDLARRLNRPDLEVVASDWLEGPCAMQNIAGRGKHIVLDHALNITTHNAEAINYLHVTAHRWAAQDARAPT